jgi:hypothetical protein
MSNSTTIGLDLAKPVFQVHGTDEDGRPVVRKTPRRGQVHQSGISPNVTATAVRPSHVKPLYS